MQDDTPEETTAETEGDALAAVGDLITKAANDPKKVVVSIQALRNDAELSGDLEAAERYTQAIGLLMVGSGEADPGDLEEDMAADEEQDAAPGEGDLEEKAAAPMEEGEEEEEADKMIAMSARANLKKAGRKIAASRMAIMKQAAMAYLKVLAEAGDTDSAKMLKAIESPGGLMDGKALIAELQKSMNAPLETVAKAVLNLHERMSKVEAQPAPGGPVARFAGQPVAKSLGNQPGARAAVEADPSAIEALRRRYLLEGDPSLKAQYQAQLKALTGD